ncbi:MAG: tetratricopeptide repeat protein [Gammaproteobacteria bacterium]|nr:tetratricopeptide repeat protein [Gammaproteobacteria bacterium]
MIMKYCAEMLSINKIRPVVLSVFVLFAASCAVDQMQTRQEESRMPVVSLDVDSDTEDDFNRAVSYLKDKEYDKAIPLLESIIKTEKRFAAPYVNLGMAYIHTGNNELAEKNLRSALDIDLGHAVANNELGQLYRKAGRFDDAKKAYENALVVHEAYLPARKNLGILCELYMRDFSCALEHFELYQKYAPDDKTINIWVADLKRRLGQ